MLARRDAVCGMHVHVEVPASRPARGPHEPAATLHARAARALRLVALLGGTRTPASMRVSPVGMGRDAAHRIAGAVCRHRRLRAVRRGDGAVRSDRRRELPVVDAAALDSLPDARASGRRQLHAAEGYVGDRGALLQWRSLTSCRQAGRLSLFPPACTRRCRGDAAALTLKRAGRCDALSELCARSIARLVVANVSLQARQSERRHMFFFSSKLGCAGSIVISIIATIILLAVLGVVRL